MFGQNTTTKTFVEENCPLLIYIPLWLENSQNLSNDQFHKYMYVNQIF